MFAPHHQASADEIVRVCRSGGRIGLINWTPQGFIGQMFATMKPYAPPPPPGAQPPPLWGDEDHVRGLFGDRIAEVTAVRQTLKVDRFETPEEFREFFKETYGPTIAVYKAERRKPGCDSGSGHRPGRPRPHSPRRRRCDGVGVSACHRSGAVTSKLTSREPLSSPDRSGWIW